MKIAVYDNDYKSSAKLKSLLYLYSDYKKADFVVDVFADCNEIFNFSNDYPLIFLSIENEYGKNTVIISKDGAEIVDSDCKDRACLGKISKNGDFSVCLPHKLIVRAEGEKEVDGVAY